MKVLIYDLEELRESKQFYERELPRYGIVIAYIILILILSLLIWSIFSYVNVYIKFQGIVKQIKEGAVVVNKVAGEVKKVYVKEGDYVKKRRCIVRDGCK
ncbi:hypothetical protein [Caldicellulosiruptor acetigenus]|uniref:hypothetical protein n=1 Tax=Caldicellulosiruptor acetigenus TaxID=301953 RepID=UPI0001E9B711|nr:hypothetical protein [Caldicellulosiruptor acetigenus]